MIRIYELIEIDEALVSRVIETKIPSRVEG